MKKFSQILKNNKGFTLVELITVIVILGILMALVVPTFNSVIDRADQANVESLTRNIYASATANAKADRDVAGNSAVLHIFGAKLSTDDDSAAAPHADDGLNGADDFIEGSATVTYVAAAADDAGLPTDHGDTIEIFVDAAGNVGVEYNNGVYQCAMYKSELEVTEVTE